MWVALPMLDGIILWSDMVALRIHCYPKYSQSTGWVVAVNSSGRRALLDKNDG